jgi:hypothetical protein
MEISDILSTAGTVASYLGLFSKVAAVVLEVGTDLAQAGQAVAWGVQVTPEMVVSGLDLGSNQDGW